MYLGGEQSCKGGTQGCRQDHLQPGLARHSRHTDRPAASVPSPEPVRPSYTLPPAVLGSWGVKPVARAALPPQLQQIHPAPLPRAGHCSIERLT